jgi:hypothetical protein
MVIKLLGSKINGSPMKRKKLQIKKLDSLKSKRERKLKAFLMYFWIGTLIINRNYKEFLL